MATSSKSPRAITTERVALRVRLGNGHRSGPVDGAWWPQSRDLQSEAADLVDNFPTSVGRIGRLLFSRPDWDAVAGAASTRRIMAKRGAVKVGSFPRDDTHLMIMKMGSGERLKLLVIPSDTSPADATQIMEEATVEGSTQTPAVLLGLL